MSQLISCLTLVVNRKGGRYGATIGGGGGRGLFEVDSFHATPIGIMLNAEKIAVNGPPPPPPPPVPPPMVNLAVPVTNL